MNLTDYRKELDGIDRELIGLFCRRMEICGKIGEWKRENGKPVLDAEREREKEERFRANADPRFADYAGALYRVLAECSRAFQSGQTVTEDRG